MKVQSIVPPKPEKQHQQFAPPDFWSFKPFYTLQPVAETREKQLNCWCSLILSYCSFHNINRLDPYNFSFFKNPTLGRELSSDGVNAVINKLIQSGNAEWEDGSRTGLRIILKSPESLAGDIYSWYVLVLKTVFCRMIIMRYICSNDY